MICLYHFWETVPKQEKYKDITVIDVQFVQSKLQIITQNDVISNNEKNTDEIHLYTIDLASKKIISDEPLLSETFDKGISPCRKRLMKGLKFQKRIFILNFYETLLLLY